MKIDKASERLLIEALVQMSNLYYLRRGNILDRTNRLLKMSKYANSLRGRFDSLAGAPHLPTWLCAPYLPTWITDLSGDKKLCRRMLWVSLKERRRRSTFIR